MITPHNCESFLNLQAPCFDVRSPLEFADSAIPESHSLPLLSNEHRKAIGICYKQKGKEAAITLGYQLIYPISATFIEGVEKITDTKTIKLYCARGGLRSNKMAEFLSAQGYQVALLKGGYKAYRNYVLQHISCFKNIMILAGNTGCNKTGVLEALKQNGEQVLNLEDLANHKGSAFGAIGEAPQPSNTQFSNLIFDALQAYNPELRLWVESESITIGRIAIPIELWTNMQKANGIEIVLPLEERINFIVNTYGKHDLNTLASAIEKLSKRLGGQTTTALCELTLNNQLYPVVERLLQYYDSRYQNSKHKKNCQNYVKFELQSTHADTNCQLLLQHLQNL